MDLLENDAHFFLHLTYSNKFFCHSSYREITVQFNADVSDGLQWKFIPTQRQVCSYKHSKIHYITS